ncbi:MAG: hypothetical protein ACUVXA_04680 [Candidatus Jordarchaeum sp.]|uniref:hypothetical protein n=1 Tax=Candidatus Jordarchaeum sp. TaxID=2823881 RepID=UPI00404B9BCB
MPTWFTIAKNEYRLITSGIRSFRSLALPLLIMIPVIAFLVVIQVGNIIHFNNNSVELLRYILGVPETIILSLYPQIDVTLVVGQFISLLSFFFPIIAGLANVLREIGSENMDILFSSPVRPKDIFFGGILINLFPIPIFLSFFSIAMLPVIIEHGYPGPLFPLSVALTVVLLYISGLWIGLLLSAYLKLRSQSSPKYRDLAKVVIVIAAIIIGLAFFILSSSQTATLNMWYSPTTWTSNIIYYSVTGTNLTLIEYPGIFYYLVLLTPDHLTSLALLLIFLGAVFLMGVLLVRRIKQLDLIGEGIVTIKEEGIYKYLRKLLPTKLGRLSVVQLKEFFRDPESLTRIITVFLFPIILYFFAVTRLVSSFYSNNDPISLLISPGIAFLFIIMVGTMIGQIEATQMTVKGKLLLLTYKKAPNGINMLVLSKFVEMLILGLPLGLISGIIFQLVLGNQSPGIHIVVPVMLFMVIISCAVALGIYSARPVLQEESGGHLLNSTLIGGIVALIGGLMLLFAVYPWVLNVIGSYSTLGGILQIFPYISNLLLSIFSVCPMISTGIGVLIAITIGIFAAYFSLRFGMSKMIRYE